MKNLLRLLLRRGGHELLHFERDPILTELRATHEAVRFMPTDGTAWADALSRPAAHHCFRHVLHRHEIDLVIDVGANRGQFARLLRRIGYTNEIVSFEPLRRYREELVAAAAADGRWRVMPTALGDERGTARLHVYQDDVFSSVHAVNETARARFGSLVAEISVEEVGISRLDEVWPEIAGSANRRVLLKTDTQGHDLAVLAGATSVLPHVHAIITEAAFIPLYERAPQFTTLAGWLAHRGFVPSGLFPISHDPADGALIEIDCVFVRRRGQIPPVTACS